MARAGSGLSITAGALAAVCATALSIVFVDMVVDGWLIPLSLSNGTIIAELVLVALAAGLFFLRKPLLGTGAALVAFLIGEVLGRIMTNGGGIAWPFVNLSSIGSTWSGSPLFAVAIVMFDVAFVTLILTLILGLVASILALVGSTPTLATAPREPNAQEGIPAGWYPDPDGKPCQRYWDGTTWTNSTAPLG